MEETKNVETETKEAGTTSMAGTPDTQLFAKLDEIIEKKTSGIIKSILRDNGVDDSDIGEIVTRYKSSKQTAKNTEAEALHNLKTKNDELTKKLFDIELHKAATAAAEEIGMSHEKLEYAMKLADMKNVAKDGTIDSDAIKTALSDVLDKIPEFKKAQSAASTEAAIRKVGAAKTEPEAEDTLAKMRKAIGLA